MVLWTVAILMTILFLILLVLVFLRKLQFDAIHQNFLEFEDAFGGRVIRNGFAVRPRYAGSYKGEEFSISITSEKTEDERRYYIAINMHSDSQTSFTIMSKDWLGKRELSPERQREAISVNDESYLLEATSLANLRSMDIPKLENIISMMHPFAYVLIGKSRILLERASVNIVQDTKLEALKPLLEGMFHLKLAMG